MSGPQWVPGIRPFFEKVDLKITLHTNESPERVAKLQKKVETRCPVMNLMVSAGVDLTAICEFTPLAAGHAPM